MAARLSRAAGGREAWARGLRMRRGAFFSRASVRAGSGPWRPVDETQCASSRNATGTTPTATLTTLPRRLPIGDLTSAASNEEGSTTFLAATTARMRRCRRASGTPTVTEAPRAFLVRLCGALSCGPCRRPEGAKNGIGDALPGVILACGRQGPPGHEEDRYLNGKATKGPRTR